MTTPVLRDPVFAGPATVAQVCVVAELFPVPAVGHVSGIRKRPVDRPVTARTRGVWGDVQGDREHHGGQLKAVYAYAREARTAWAETLERDLPDGWFGENLVTTGIDTDRTVIGTRWRVGTALLEATCPRTPCRTFAEHMGDRTWVRTFLAGGRCGAYFRVLEEGDMSAGDAVEVEAVPDHGVTIADAFRGLTPDQAETLLAWSIATGTTLYESLAEKAERALVRAGRTVPEGAPRSPGR